MKKINFYFKYQLLIFIMLLINIKSFSQEDFSEYTSSFLQKTYNIGISFDKNDKFSLYIDAHSLDPLSDNGGFIVREKNLSQGIINLKTAKEKYIEWVATAKKNGVTELDKEINIEVKTGSAYFLYGREWKFDFNVKPTYNFKVFESKGVVHYLLIIRSGELNASGNEYMNVDGVAFVFASEAEIDDLLKIVTFEAIEKWKNKPKKEDLFK